MVNSPNTAISLKYIHFIDKLNLILYPSSEFFITGTTIMLVRNHTTNRFLAVEPDRFIVSWCASKPNVTWKQIILFKNEFECTCNVKLFLLIRLWKIYVSWPNVGLFWCSSKPNLTWKQIHFVKMSLNAQGISSQNFFL